MSTSEPFQWPKSPPDAKKWTPEEIARSKQQEMAGAEIRKKLGHVVVMPGESLWHPKPKRKED